MKSKSYTMQEMADELGVNKSSIYRQLKKQSIAPATTEGNTNYYDATTMQRLKKHFKSSDTKESKQDILVATLQQQIADLKTELSEQKVRVDKQLKAKDDQIASLHKLMDQNQQLLLNEQNQKMIDDKNTTNNNNSDTKKDAISTNIKTEETEIKKQKSGFWTKIFGKK